MKNFNYDGEYPGLVNGDWIVDEKDGHLWLNIPSVGLLNGFPEAYSLHFMESPKEYGSSNFIMHDEVMVINNVQFDKVLKTSVPKTGVQDYYSIKVGQDILAPVPDHVPVGVTIGSILIKTERTKELVSVINLRSVLSLDIVRKLRMRFAIELRTAIYGLQEFKDVDLGAGVKMSLDTFFVPAPIEHFKSKRVLLSSPEHYQTYLAGLTHSDQWFAQYASMPFYAVGNIEPPPFTLTRTEQGLNVIGLMGDVIVKQGYTGIKSIMIPAFPGLNVVIRINSFTQDGVVIPYLDVTKEKFVNFNVVSNFVEVIR